MNAFNFAIIVLLLVFAGFLAGTEASLNSISRIAVEELISTKTRKCLAVKSYFKSK